MHNQPISFIRLAWSADVRMRAIKVALIVGSVLAIINHSDALLDGTFSTKNYVQIVLTYLVPYCVSTYSSVSTLRANFHTTLAAERSAK